MPLDNPELYNMITELSVMGEILVVEMKVLIISLKRRL